MIEYIEMTENDMFVRIEKETPENIIGKRNHDTGKLVSKCFKRYSRSN